MAKTADKTVTLPDWVHINKDLRSRHLEAWFDEFTRPEPEESNERTLRERLLDNRRNAELALRAGIVELDDGYELGDLTIYEKSEMVERAAEAISKALQIDPN